MEGSVEVKGKVSYASQDPWVFSGTVRDNILFGSHFDKEWYNAVVEACALVKVATPMDTPSVLLATPSVLLTTPMGTPCIGLAAPIS